MVEVAKGPPGAKKLDYWWTVLATDPIAVPLTKLLAERRWLTPNQVSVVAVLMGLSVGPVFAMGTRISLVAGALLFYVTFIVDCVDGKLARALNETSPRGAALDKLGDASRRASASAGLTIWLARAESVSEHAFWWAVGYTVAAYFFLEVSGESEVRQASWFLAEREGSGRRSRRWSAALARRRCLPNPGMPDVQAIVFILGPLTGLVVPALAVGTGMVTAGMLINVWRRLH